MDDDLKKKVIDHYQKGQGSIQDIARVYRLTVDEVLHAIGEDDMATVSFSGDMIDAKEAGPGVEMNHGQIVNVPFTTN